MSSGRPQGLLRTLLDHSVSRLVLGKSFVLESRSKEDLPCLTLPGIYDTVPRL